MNCALRFELRVSGGLDVDVVPSMHVIIERRRTWDLHLRR